MENKTMIDKIIYLTSIGFGSLLSLSGILGFFFGIIEIIDPIGSKMADDSDPFGIPRTISESVTLTLVYVLIFVFGVSLILGFKRVSKRFSKFNLK